ncbi:MAG: nitroreductase family protein [Firmicutes bacterium]|nr:nitroreductase family protein [Bacillota bacterium]
MEFSKLIEERRSVRKYKSGVEITKAEIEEILKAAQQAPSWKNSQTGRYYIALSPEAVSAVSAALPSFNQNNSANAAALIVTAFEMKNAGFMPDGSQVNELGDQWGAYDLGLQNSYFILKAKELGYDTLIMGIRDEKALRAVFNIPASQQVTAVLALGKRENDPTAPKRKELEEIAVFK